MAASYARIQANRHNAESSTGPRTRQGKQRSAANSLRHGLTARNPLVPADDPQLYQQFCAAFRDDLKPVGTLEEQLVQTLVDTRWRLNRCRSIEQAILDGEAGAAQIDSLNKLSLYEHRLSRNFHSALREFLALKAERKQKEEKEMKDAVKVLKLCRNNRIPFDPAAHGFVFSESEIERWLVRLDRIELAHQAGMWDFNRRFFNIGQSTAQASAA